MVKSLGCRFGVDHTSGFVYGGRGWVLSLCHVRLWLGVVKLFWKRSLKTESCMTWVGPYRVRVI